MLVISLITLVFLAIVGLCAQDVFNELLAPALAVSSALVGVDKPSASGGGLAPEPGTLNPEPRIYAPLISVLIPARNEARRIGACLAGLVTQGYRHVEVIVVDDHSTDATAAVVGDYTPQLPALALATSAALPPGWAGKCWACWQGAAQARGEWLLFLDADVEPLPGLIGALVACVEHSGAEAITLMPLLRMGSIAERLLLPAFQTILYGVYPLRLVNDPRSPIAFANGQVLLIRRAVYDAVGGHQAVRGSVLEDTDFGQLVKAAGYRLHAASARDLVTVRMYDDWASTAEGLGKNAVAGYRSGGWRSGWVGFRQALIAFGPLYLLGAGVVLWANSVSLLGLATLAHGIALVAITSCVYGWLFRRRYRIAPLWALGYPLGLALYYALALRGLVRVRSGRGVRWKGRVLDGR